MKSRLENYPSGELTPAASPNNFPPTRFKLKKHMDIAPLEAVIKSRRTSDIKEADKANEKLSREDLKKLLDKALENNKNSITSRRKIRYEVIEEADLVQVQVIDSDTGDIIRKIPADEVVELVKDMNKFFSERLDLKA